MTNSRNKAGSSTDNNDEYIQPILEQNKQMLEFLTTMKNPNIGESVSI